MAALFYTLLVLGLLATLPLWFPLGLGLLIVGLGVMMTVAMVVLVLLVVMGVTFPLVVLGLAVIGMGTLFATTPRGQEAVRFVRVHFKKAK